MCNLDVLGDEYHFFFECAKPDIVTLRQQYIPRHYLQSPIMFNLIQLLKSSDDVNIGKRISMFIKNAKLHRSTIFVCTEITEVNLSAFVYRLFHEDFSSIYNFICTYVCIIFLCHILFPMYVSNSMCE